jgi:hypothetical protein
MSDRASGRTLSEIQVLDRRLQDLLVDLRSMDVELAYESPSTDSPAGNSMELAMKGSLMRACLFTWEALAWALIQRLRAELFSRRAELPRTDADLFPIFQREGLLDIAEARRLRQFCELRHLSTRDFSRLSPLEIHAGSMAFLPELEAFLARLAPLALS